MLHHPHRGIHSLGAQKALAREASRKHTHWKHTLSLFMVCVMCMGVLGFFQGSPSLAGSSLKSGMNGGEVKALQNKLAALDYVKSSDGAFGPKTESAVTSFQRDHDLEADGIAGPATQKALKAAYDKVAMKDPLRKGDEGTQVKTLQKILIAQGYLKGTADGKFGPKTEKAVIQLQTNHGITADGVVGPGTRKAMDTPCKKDPASGGRSKGQKVVDEAMKYLGIRYKYAAASPSKGFDCSGLVYYVYKQLGTKVPRSSAGFRGYATKVESLDKAKPGDVLCWSGHVGIYIGNNQFIHAPQTGDVVRIADVKKKPVYICRIYD